MAGLLSRFTNFVPNTTILSNDHNQELNRIVNLLNGTTTNLKTVLKTSDAGDPPLELDQLSTGPILKAFQGGVLKFQISNAGNLLFNQSGGFIGDQNGNEYLKFATVAAAVNELEISNAAAAGRPKIALTGGDANIGLDISPKGTGQVFITGSSPLRLPNVTPSNNDDAARKLYVDDKVVPFALGFRIDDPSTFALNSDSAMVAIRVPAIVPGGAFITKLVILRAGGTHTAGGSVTFKARIFNGSTIGAGVSFDDTNNAINTPYTDDFTDTAISEGNFLLVHITARSGTITETLVNLTLEGYQKVKTL